MIKFSTVLTPKKIVNFVTIIESLADIKKMDFLKLSEASTKELHKKITDKKNISLQYTFGETTLSRAYIFLYLDNKNTLIDSASDFFKKLPDTFTIFVPNKKNEIDILNLSILARYNFQDYKTEKKVDSVDFITTKDQLTILKNRYETIKNICIARDLGSMPSNDLTPESFANIIKVNKWKNTKIKILGPKNIEKKGLHLIHAVGKGSENKPYIVILEKIVDKKLPTYGIVGKGITFDSGGIQVKPGDSMYEMKGDMCGAAGVYGLMKELDNKKLNVNIIAAISLAENAISSTSYKPSDIINSYAGKTVNIIHTDAEGRLVLADGVSYLSKNYKIDNMMTVATLTGACMVGLGFRYAGIMGTDRVTINALLRNSKTSYEKYCELPFDDYFIEKCKSDIADLENLNRGVYAGSTMGGAFLSHFLLNNEKYTHLDIAGTAINSYEPYGLVNKGMTGFGVHSLSDFFLSI